MVYMATGAFFLCPCACSLPLKWPLSLPPLSGFEWVVLTRDHQKQFGATSFTRPLYHIISENQDELRYVL